MFYTLCSDYGIRFIADGCLFSLYDVVVKIIGSKSAATYITKVKTKIKMDDGLYYITVKDLISKLETCKKKTAKDFLMKVKMYV